MNLTLFWAQWGGVITTVLTLALGVLSIWLKNNRDTEAAKAEISHIIGSVIAAAIVAAHGEMGLVTDDQLKSIADAFYDKLTDMLPVELHDLALKLYTKEEFEQNVINAWRKDQNRQAVAK